MLTDFLFSINATLPVFAVMVLGWLLRKACFLTEGFCKTGNKLVFRLCLPAMLFRQIIAMRPEDLTDGGFLAYAFGGTLATVPSRIFNNACCTPSPDTSRVMDGFSLLRAILSISSI